MTGFQAALLGVVQGVAEFLPISSSGHLVIVQKLLNIPGDHLFFDVFVHLATLIAVFFYFRKEIFSITRKEILAVVVASVPAAFVGVFLEEYLSPVFNSLFLVSVFLIVTGIVNIFSEWKLRQKTEVRTEVGVRTALIIGIFQAVAILPGISRSGSTVAAGIFRNIDRKIAFRFSFFMIIPVVLGATLLQLLQLLDGAVAVTSLTNILIGGVTAFMSGLLSLRLFEYVVVKAKFALFGVYCIVMGTSLVLLVQSGIL